VIPIVTPEEMGAIDAAAPEPVAMLPLGALLFALRLTGRGGRTR